MYAYKFLKDVIFADGQNSEFSWFYYQGLFVISFWAPYALWLFLKKLIFMDYKLLAKTNITSHSLYVFSNVRNCGFKVLKTGQNLQANIEGFRRASYINYLYCNSLLLSNSLLKNSDCMQSFCIDHCNSEYI